MNNDIKSFCLKSAYGTGKTKLIIKLLDEYKNTFKKVLFISYRQTLSNELYSLLKDLNIDTYMNHDFNKDRTICQIESLSKLIQDDFIIDNIIKLQKYDLIIIDECESVLNHFQSPTIKDKQFTFDLMTDLCSMANKLLLFDGDFENRSYNFVKEFGKSIIIENVYKTKSKNFIFTNNKAKFEYDLITALENGKNVCIVSMSSSFIYRLEHKFKNKYKCIVHTSKSDDSLKEELKDVNKLWIKYQLIMYSPTIESGIDFNIEHVNKIYVILSPNSTSPRGLLQMIARCRQVSDDYILVYLNKMYYNETGCFYQYNEIENYVKCIANEYIDKWKPVKYIDNDGKICYKYEYDLYFKILVYNQLEKANSCNVLFLPCLIQLLKEKGHTYIKDDITVQPQNKCSKNIKINKDEIIKSKDIDENTYNNYLIKQINNKLTKDEKIEIERYIFKNIWKTDLVNEELNDFIDKYYEHTSKLKNLRYLLDETKINDVNYDFDKAIIKEKVSIIKDIISLLEYDIDNLDKLDKETFNKNMQNVITKSKLFTEPTKTMPLFGLSKNKLNKIETVKSFMGLINSIFNEWGLKICIEQKTVSKTIDKIKTYICINNYNLQFINKINNYV